MHFHSCMYHKNLWQKPGTFVKPYITLCAEVHHFDLTNNFCSVINNFESITLYIKKMLHNKLIFKMIYFAKFSFFLLFI